MANALLYYLIVIIVAFLIYGIYKWTAIMHKIELTQWGNEQFMLKRSLFCRKCLELENKVISLHCVFHSIRFKVNRVAAATHLFYLSIKTLILSWQTIMVICPATVRTPVPVLSIDCLPVMLHSFDWKRLSP